MDCFENLFEHGASIATNHSIPKFEEYIKKKIRQALLATQPAYFQYLNKRKVTIQILRATLAVHQSLPSNHGSLSKAQLVGIVIERMTRVDFNNIVIQHNLTSSKIAEAKWRELYPSRRGKN